MDHILPLITGSAGAIVVLAFGCYLFLTGKLHSDAELAAVRQDNATLKAALERTRDALELSNARNETGVLSAEIIAQALGVRSRRQEDEDRWRERGDEDAARGASRDREDRRRRDQRAAEDGHGEGHHVPSPEN